MNTKKGKLWKQSHNTSAFYFDFASITKSKKNTFVDWLIIILIIVTIVFVLYTFMYQKKENFDTNPNRVACFNSEDPEIASNDFNPWIDPCKGISDDTKSTACVRYGNVKNQDKQSQTCTFSSSDQINQYCQKVYDSSYSWPSQYGTNTQHCCLPAGRKPAISAPEQESNTIIKCKIPP